MSGIGYPPLRIREVDGSPNVIPVDTIVVSNATLTDDGGAQVTVTTGGGGGMTKFDVVGDGSGSAQEITDGNTLTIAGGTGLTTVASATDTLTVTLDDTAVTAAAYTHTALTVDAQGRITGASSGTAPPSAANPSAEVAGTKVDGTASTFMRSDAAPALADTAVTAASDGSSSGYTHPDPILLDAGSAAAPTYSYSTDTDTGLFLDGSNGIGFSGGGTKQMNLSPNGTLTLGSGSHQAILTSSGTYDLLLETNLGVNSGTITITDGVDGDIGIVPNGEGNVNLGNLIFDADQVPGAGTDDYVLTYNDTSKLISLEEGGGGGGGWIAIPTLTSASFDLYNITIAAPYGISRRSTDSLDDAPSFFPFYSPESGDVAAITIRVTSAAGSACNALVGLYNQSAGIPTTKIAEAAIDVTSTGDIRQTSFTGTPTLVKDSLYFLGIARSELVAVTLATIDNQYASCAGPVDNAEDQKMNLELQSSSKVLPATVDETDLETAYTKTPVVLLEW